MPMYAAVREIKVLRRYHIQKREDYQKYTRLCGRITKMAAALQKLDSGDEVRVATTKKMLDKL